MARDVAALKKARKKGRLVLTEKVEKKLIQQGENIRAEEMAQRMLNRDFAQEMVVELTGLSRKEVKKVTS